MTPLSSRLHALLICALLVTIAVRFAEPILDGDLFVHMAYARHMLAHRTLIVDHAAFSWTPARTDMIYCAWASELLFYGLWEHLGIASLFVFRYLIILAVVGLAYAHARRLGLARSPPEAVLRIHTGVACRRNRRVGRFPNRRRVWPFAPKGRNSIAQGIALGIGSCWTMSPEGA